MSGLRCDHKFVDSTRCLKCGWKPWEPNRTPLMPRPELAPLSVMDETKLADAQDLASQATDEVDTFAVQIALCDALVELDAQRRAHATAYAEGQRAALQSAMHIAVTCNRDDRTADEIAGEIQRKLLALIRALRDTPAPRREDA
jgi:hypothetical protein